MGIQFAGLGSGLPINDWITQLVDIKRTSTITPLESKKQVLTNSNSALGILKNSFTSLQSAVKGLQQNAISDVWGSSSVKSSDSEYITATSTSNAANATTTVKILQLATSTVAKSADSVAKTVDEDTKFKSIGNNTAKEGTFTFYVDNKKYSVEIGENDTLGDIRDKINDLSGGTATAKVNGDGTFEISAGAGSTLSIGSSADTSNFKSIMQLSKITTDASGTSIKSAYIPSQVSTSKPLTSEEAGFATSITEGTIKINGQEFKIDGDVALNDLIKSINANKDAKVSASFDTLTNKLVLTSTATGEFNIALEQDGTNFFTAMGLMDGDNIKADTQTLGKNAKAVVNGNEVTSSSNVLTSSTTGVTGLTITLVKEQTGDKAGKEINLTVSTDSYNAKKAMQTFIDAYNTVANQVYEATKSNGYLEMDSGLRQIMQSLRDIATAVNDNDGAFSMLSKIGLTTSRKGGSIEEETRTLKADSDALNKAFDDNFDSVRKLLSNNGEGLMDKLYDKLNSVLSTDGYFATKSSTLSQQLKTADQNITRATTQLDNYKAQLTRQFNYMDSMIAKLNSQYSAFTTGASS